MSIDATPTIDLLSPASFARGQPHDQFRWLRRHAPVWRHPRPEGFFWAVTKYEDVRAIGRDHRTFSSEAGGIHTTDPPPQALAVLRNMMLYQDPPKHHRYRRLVRDPFQPDAAESLRPAIEELAQKIVGRVAPWGACDLVEHVAGELPSAVIAHMLGIPHEDSRRLYRLTETMHSATASPEETGAAVMEMLRYAAAIREEKLRRPADDLATALVRARVKDHGELSPEEFCWFFLLLVNAGGDTTRNAVAGGMLALFEHPEERRRLHDNLDGLLPTAVEEMLRWCSPVVYFRRTATTDTTIRGTDIAAGDAVALYYGSANRDEEVFGDPDRFDVARQPNDHLAFGGGVHFCLGVHVARIEMQAVLREILTKLPDMEPAGEVEWLESNFISGPRRLPVRYTPR